MTRDPEATATRLRQLIRRRAAGVGVVGLGYAGLPLALAFAEKGFGVLGFDLDEAKIEALARGESYIRHLDRGRVQRAVAAQRLAATADLGRLGEPDVLLVCVPTPLTAQRAPDLSHVVDTMRAIRRSLRRAQLVVLESTTYPGTTDEVVAPILEEAGLRCGRDFFLAYSPEREDPGNPERSIANVPKVVGGVDETSGDLGQDLYAHIAPATVRVSSARAAEATKLLENVFRAVNIALVNELKMVYDGLGIDIWEVLEAAATKPFGFMRFDPGPGWGGHCIPIDPFYLAWKTRQHGVATRFIELAGEVNRSVTEYVIAKLSAGLAARGKALRGSSVLLLGLAYKRDVADPRESAAFEITSRLLELGAAVAYHDPHVPQAPRMRSWPGMPALSSQPLTPATLAGQDAVVLVTDHGAVDYQLVLDHSSLIIDTRGVYRHPAHNVVRA